MNSVIRYKRLHPLPAKYKGPTPVFMAQSPREPGFSPCLVRQNEDGDWETALWADPTRARFNQCPVSDASQSRTGAVRAHQFYHSLSQRAYK